MSAAFAKFELLLLSRRGERPYKLTQNLTATGHCLTLVGNFITLDLNGFAITGDGGSGDFGIRMSGAVATLTGMEIRNGTITNFGRGIYLGTASGVVVERVRALRNTSDGILLGNTCVFKDNIVAQNDSDGLAGSAGCVATGNTASQNGGTDCAAQ